MPVINCIELTKPAIDSIQHKGGMVLHLIDNGSTDGTRAFGEMMHGNTMAGGKIMNYIRNEKALSVAGSWNQGIKRALEDPECKYIFIVNNDIICHDKTLTHLISFMDATGYMMVTGDNIKDRMSIEVMVQQELPKEYTDFDMNKITDWLAEGPDFSCFLITPETIEKIGWFDEHFEGAYCEDQDYHARINRAWRWGLQYGEPNPDKMHAKRLSTAPYFHYASQTLTRNHALRQSISTYHGRNQNYYLQKWGGEHPAVMDGAGNQTPFGDATKNWKDW
jgi:glycosyltransferase involved in cell wall biosynthesis